MTERPKQQPRHSSHIIIIIIIKHGRHPMLEQWGDNRVSWCERVFSLRLSLSPEHHYFSLPLPPPPTTHTTNERVGARESTYGSSKPCVRGKGTRSRRGGERTTRRTSRRKKPWAPSTR